MAYRGDRAPFTSEDSDSEDANNGLVSGERKKRTYNVGGRGGEGCFPWKLSRNEWICVLVGVAGIVGVVILFVVIGVSVAAANASRSSGEDSEPWEGVRLPSSILPEDYDIQLTVNLTNFAVKGQSSINVNVVDETRNVLLHAKDMDIVECSVSQNGENMKIESTFFHLENDFYVIVLEENLRLGAAQLHFTFSYQLGKTLVGFYRSSYNDSAGDTHWLATTQFEPTDARKAFPCFDEPALKANFTISLTHDASLNAHSNMPVRNEAIVEGGMKKTSFYTSVKMSTYLVAFVVSDFSCIFGSSNAINVSVCAAPHVVEHTEYALQTAITVLNFYEQLFHVPYPLPKQDLFAIPDFSSGAMENWGLITYRETALLYNPEEDPESSKQRVAVVIAHELAHQWFGNLVTMEWWDGLWLNEGFATFTEYLGANSSEPSFDMLEQFIVDDVFVAFRIDGLNESHPIVQTVSNPDQINELFDSISYSKGGSVIRMLRGWMGVNFQLGITCYLMKYKYGNANTQDLWTALQTAVEGDDMDVTEMMNTWTLQMGYPVLTVNTESGQVKQERFFYMQPNGSIASSPYNYLWQVPFDYLSEGNSSSQFVEGTKQLLKKKTQVVHFPSQGFLKVNVGQTGFYRTNYDRQNWLQLVQHLHDNPDSQILSPGDRAGLLADAFALSSAGLLDMCITLNLSKYIQQERSYVPLVTGLSGLRGIGAALSLTGTYGPFQEFMRNITKDLVQEFNFNRTDLDHLQTFLRSAVLSSAYVYGNQDVIDQAKQLFEAWRDRDQSVVSDVKSVVYSVGVAHGTEDDWDFVWNKYLVTSDPYEKNLYLSALGHSRVPWILSRYLNYSITKVRSQDTLSVIGHVSANIHGRYLAWTFVRENWNYFTKVYGGGSFSFSRLIKTVTTKFTTEVELNEVESFFKQQSDLGSGVRAVRQAVEIIRHNIQWLKKNEDLVSSYLHDPSTSDCPNSS